MVWGIREASVGPVCVCVCVCVCAVPLSVASDTLRDYKPHIYRMHLIKVWWTSKNYALNSEVYT